LNVNHQGKVWRPPTDVYETGSEIVVRVEIAGMNERELNVELVGRTLIVSGHRVDHTGRAKLAYQRMEILYGEFRTEVHLPWAANASAVDATYDNGLLTVVLPKASTLHVPISEATD
jgi:HSP20 family protein